MPEMRAAKGQYFRGDELPNPVQAGLTAPGAAAADRSGIDK
jgi:hypothetical protein